MILRKVSNLKPGDRIVLHDSVITVELIEPLPPVADQFLVQFVDAPTRELFADDLVEIVIL